MTQTVTGSALVNLNIHGNLYFIPSTHLPLLNVLEDYIEALKLKKATYEQVLKRQLDDLDRDFALLQMQSQELSVRAGKNQIKMPLAA